MIRRREGGREKAAIINRCRGQRPVGGGRVAGRVYGGGGGGGCDDDDGDDYDKCAGWKGADRGTASRSLLRCGTDRWAGRLNYGDRGSGEQMFCRSGCRPAADCRRRWPRSFTASASAADAAAARSLRRFFRWQQLHTAFSSRNDDSRTHENGPKLKSFNNPVPIRIHFRNRYTYCFRRTKSLSISVNPVLSYFRLFSRSSATFYILQTSGFLHLSSCSRL